MAARRTSNYFFFADFFVAVFFLAACDRALPAADLEVFEVRPSVIVFEAFEAAFADVFFAGALRWDRALPAALFDVFDVFGHGSHLVERWTY